MANKNLKIGDIVVLKSGSPEMTIENINSPIEGKALCTWFDGKKNEHARFALEALELVKE